MKKIFIFIVMLILLFTNVNDSSAQQRFPKPEFEKGHVQPPTISPAPNAEYLEYIDLFILFAGLALISWVVIKKRSRRAVFWISIFSIIYFGFIRKACVCPVGSIQNVTLALFNPEYSIPISVVGFFVMPLLFTLFFGRTFCAGICPLGAIQDIFAIRPVNLQTWVQKSFGMIPYIYFGLAVLYAATSTDFVICRYDPFIGIYRFDGSFIMFLIGGILLITSIFIARPYCRFFCPYGVLLNLISKVSVKHMSITPASCIQCRLCEDSCPFGSIEKPVPEANKEPRQNSVKRFIMLGLIIPLLVIAGGWTGAKFHENLARVNPKVSLAKELLSFDGKVDDNTSEEIKAFTMAEKSEEELFSEAAAIVKDFYIGGWLLGGFIGLVFGLSLLGLSIFRYRKDYVPNRSSCLSCLRCVDYCPVEPGFEEKV